MRILGFILAVLLGYASFIDAANNRLTLQGKDLFISGTNVPWVSFANDFADSDGSMPAFKEAIIKVREAGGNAIRVWIYTDCSYAPKFGSDGLVSGMGTKTVENVKTLLDTAEEYGVVVDLCFLSFDMMQPGGENGGKAKDEYSTYNLENNLKILTTDEGLKAFIDKAVTPLVSAEGIKGHKALMCWEVFNEPEGMSQEHGWTADKLGKEVPMSDIQKVVNRVAAACKKADPNTLVSNGAQCPKYVSANSIGENYYSDEALKAAGGEATGTLDFYMMHYYALWQAAADSPFEQDAANWNLDKPVIIGEFHIGGIEASAGAANGVNDLHDVSIEDCYEGSYDKGYAGALSWMYAGHEDGTFEGSVDALKNLYDKYTDDIKIKEFVPPTDLGNSMMIEFNGLSSDPGAAIKLDKSLNLSANKTIKCRVKVAPDADNNGTMQVQFVVKTGENWDWRQANDDNIFDVKTSMTEWQDYEVKFDDMAAWNDPNAKPDPSNIKSVLFKFLGNNFKGKILIDDIVSGETVISDFNDGFGLWSPDEDKENAIVAITSFFDEHQSEVLDAEVVSDELTLSVYPNPFNPVTNIAFNLPTSGKVSANVYNVKGDLVQKLSNSYLEKGAHQFTFNGNKLSSGVYFLKIATVGAVKTTKMILLK